uniref:SEA domain-containing protein n=1 Tax=Taeniopygia guttata TaxID=59729 RepID=H0YPY3_TAEGU
DILCPSQILLPVALLVHIFPSLVTLSFFRDEDSKVFPGPLFHDHVRLILKQEKTPTQPPTTTAAALERFTVNFTITNLPYTSDLENPDSAKFRATRRVMNMMISVFCRPGSHRDETRVDAICSYSKEPSAAPLDRVGLYHQVSNKTRGITQLGPYSLDKDSLYVNGDRNRLQVWVPPQCPFASPYLIKGAVTLMFPTLWRLDLLSNALLSKHLSDFQPS